MSYTSTIPGAVSALYGYAQTVAASVTNQMTVLGTGTIGTSIGWPTGSDLPAYLIMIGDYDADGDNIVTPVTSSLTTNMPVGNYLLEQYKINCSIICFGGNADTLGYVTDAFTIYSAIVEQMVLDNNADGALGPVGTWGGATAALRHNGQMSDAQGNPTGWGAVVVFSVQPINVKLALY